ncbi:MAG: ribonuclease HI [Candidatus Marinimicrobia bacterium]|nr:ribonuclease HI [Candidatus Neomarinimicrobiota bacterium]
MNAKANKFYAVFQGKQPGIYNAWEDVNKQVSGFKGAKYKSFSNRDEAVEWLRECVLSAKESVDESLIEIIKTHLSDFPSSTVHSSRRSENQIIIHTDGGASPNPGVGGYGVVLEKGSYRKELSAGYQLTTNNRMELMACIAALQALNEPSELILYTDSKYVVDSITKGWVERWRTKGWKKSDGQLAENIDLWIILVDLLEIHSVQFQWVKGHAGNKENERCDVLANGARKSKHLLKDSGYHKH